MGYIQDRINSKLPKALDGKLSDATEPFEASRVTAGGEYNPVTGTYDQTTETWQGRWIKGSWITQQIDGVNILATDTKRLVMQVETEWAPAVDDVVNGLTVMSVGKDPADTLWILNLRRS